jgi:hypothetical protein
MELKSNSDWVNRINEEPNLNNIFYKNTINGHCDYGIFLALNDIVKMLPSVGTMFEIGTMFGRSTVFLAELFRLHNKSYTIYSIDLFSEPNISKDFFDIAKSNCEKYKEINLIRCDLFEANTHIELKDKKFTCVLECSNHDLKATTFCLNTWLPLLEDNGIYCGHDWIKFFPEIEQIIIPLVGNKVINKKYSKQQLIWWLNGINAQ